MQQIPERSKENKDCLIGCRKMELLAPGGDINSIKAAIVAGADAVYCGLNRFNARNRAANISLDDLQGILRLAHKNDCQVFLTLNILILESEIPALIRLLNKLVNTSIDGIIVQDLGVFYLLSRHFKDLKIHASTQLTTHNKGQILFLNKLNATRINLSRELSLPEIKALSSTASENNILSEVFVHGSFCISFSGICYISSLHGGNSGNRGRCSQPCRDRYLTTPAGKNYPLNLKDNSAWFNIKELYDAGVDSLKIEGRIKEFEYVYTVVNTWKKQIQDYLENGSLVNDNSDLYKVFNRDFTNGYLKGEISKEMFIDNPMSHSTNHHSEIHKYTTEEKKILGRLELYDEKEVIRKRIKEEIDLLSIEKAPLLINISGENGSPLKIAVKTPDSSFIVLSAFDLVNEGTESLNQKMVLKRLKALDETEYYIDQLELNLESDLFLPFKELTAIKKRLLYILNGSKDFVDPINIPILKRQNKSKFKPSLSVLISQKSDVFLSEETSANIYFRLPDGLKNKLSDFIDLFKKNKKLIPWFPSILIAEDYTAALEFLQQVKPKFIVTNNTGVAYEAYKTGISWIAGPYLNTVNSYSLLTLKENFNCSGSFISNEINKHQIHRIIAPENFDLYYSIYHPIVLLSSRQCLFHQVTGCEKIKLDDECISHCEKSSSITNLKNETFFIEKTLGNYHTLFNETNFLNTEIVKDMPDHFSRFFIDLTEVKTKTNIKLDKPEIITLFENLLKNIPGSEKELKKVIYPTTSIQYKKGI